jgi:hypothetical protein
MLSIISINSYLDILWLILARLIGSVGDIVLKGLALLDC